METPLSTIYRLYQEAGILTKLKDYIYSDDTYRKRNSGQSYAYFVFLWHFKQRWKNWIYRHSTGFLNYTSVLTNSVILLGVPNVPIDFFPNIYSFSGQNWASELIWHELFKGWCESDVDSQEHKDLLEYIQSRPLSPCRNIKTFNFSIALYNYSPT